eukprot:CAMPEP_0181320470 /NCGR_PEP_ID=MMETSP1101-20121128/18141_1 /TAXON_ID=46948 /ORGANISM="Rhodomonas abbreviata, Strain Caron Lab Isolate" /LENGTH=262 /DNA_ID=CAMNT_0023428177 /DNA_START=32 /DNA_END=818 /DNA_ORIENTATION=-
MIVARKAGVPASGVAIRAARQVIAPVNRSVQSSSSFGIHPIRGSQQEEQEHGWNRAKNQWKWAGYVCLGAAAVSASQGALIAHAEAKKPANTGTANGSVLAGKWRKVEEVGLDHFLCQMGLSWVFRKAATLLTYMDISADDSAVKIVTQGGYVISITEFDGSPRECSRRDNRSGKHIGKVVEATAKKVVLNIIWDDPYGGEMFETFEVLEDGKMKQTTKVKVNTDSTTGKPGEWYTCYSVFNREDDRVEYPNPELAVGVAWQ